MFDFDQDTHSKMGIVLVMQIDSDLEQIKCSILDQRLCLTNKTLLGIPALLNSFH